MDNKKVIKEIKEVNRLNWLYGRINTLNHYYYNNHISLVKDFEYDCLVNELESLEKKYPQYKKSISPTNSVSKDNDSYFSKVIHSYPMLSLQNTYNEKEVDSFIDKLPTKNIIIEEKIDGVALSLIYENGVLIRASTRGDGETGDDVTENVKYILDIPFNIINSSYLEIRGEAYINREDFENINNRRMSINEEKYANPRNLASGTLKLHEPRKIKKRKLRFIAYEICTNYRAGVFDRQDKKLSWLKYVGFKVPYASLCSNNEEIHKAISFIENTQDNIAYNIDGAVLKVNDVNIQDDLGIGSKYPKWAIAYKFKAEQAITKLYNIEYNVGRTGVVTPIANLKPVSLCGTIIKRATLHNSDFIDKLKLREGCRVVIEKGGEIIPKIVEVYSYKGSEKPFYFPKNCPICGSRLYKNGDDAKWYCPDTFGKCTQLKEKLAHFVSKEALDIQGLGEEICNTLINSGKISNFMDLYKLTIEDLISLEGFKHKLASKIIKSIQDSLNKPMEKWLFAFGIPLIGVINAKELCKELGTWYNIKKHANIEHGFRKIPYFGLTMNMALTDWFKNEDNWEMVKYFKRLGMKKSYYELKSESNKLNGEKITITGSFGQYTREFLASKVLNLGGIYNDSLKSNTTILLMGDEVGKNKIAKAAKWNIKTLSKAESLELLQLK